MLSRTSSASVSGIEGVAVRVEVDVAFGLPALTIVGLAGSAVLEARERVRSALRNSGFELPARRITVNLAPADRPKEGTGFDLAIAIGVLLASGQLRPGAGVALERLGFIGELGLDGGLPAIPGIMALVAAARDSGAAAVVVPAPCVAEAAAVAGVRVHGAAQLGEAVAHVAGVRSLPVALPPPPPVWEPPADVPDLADVQGQPVARRALEIAIAGHHSLALCGPPGIGKTLLLRCAAGLLPPLTDAEATEVSRIYSVAGLTDRQRPVVRSRPIRAPHSSISTQALVGGGPRVRPGEASLAHRGVLLLDELLQFRTDALDALRQPLESGTITIARVDGALTLPARFILLTAFNPCPCGWFDARRGGCQCDPGAVRRYQLRLSGPLRDRLDLLLSMRAPITSGPLRTPPEGTAAVASRVRAAWEHQLARQGGANGEIGAGALTEGLGFRRPITTLLARRGRSLRLSPRRLHRAARVARTIADLEGEELVVERHLDEALRYRPDLPLEVAA